MSYVIDTSSFQQLFGCYKHARFPSLWNKFDELVDHGAITSIRHVMREIGQRDKRNGELEWAQTRPDLFPSVTENESLFLREIYEIPRFRHIVSMDLRDTDADADPYLIARANSIGGMVITQERKRGNRVRIPTICDHFDIKCGTLDDLMCMENWEF